MLGNVVVNKIWCAHDLKLISQSPKGLQKCINAASIFVLVFS